MTRTFCLAALSALALAACNQAQQEPQIGSSSQPDPAIQAQQEAIEDRGGERVGYADPVQETAPGAEGGRGSAATGASTSGSTEQAGAETQAGETTPP